MKKVDFYRAAGRESYPGRGIMIGKSSDARCAVISYFIMGRSSNSRNRVFVEDGSGIRTQAFDPSKMEDPSLIIYAPVRVYEDKTIVTNGDQTDTIYNGFAKGLTFEQSLRTRAFEPDAPNYTPRISGVVEPKGDDFSYMLSILKSSGPDAAGCDRITFSYDHPRAGEGRFIHTYLSDGDPLPSFEGEPTLVEISGDIDEFTNKLWKSLDADNKVSLFTRYIRLDDGSTDSRIINKNK